MVTLGDVCKVTTGQSAPQEADAFSSSGIPFVRAGSLERLCDGDSENTLELVPPEQASKYRLKVFPENTVVFAKSGMSAKVGRVHRLRRDCHLVSHLAAVLPSKDVDSGYLHRWFEYSPLSRLIENDAYPSIKTSTLEKIQLPLPSVVEQRRITAILDRADMLRSMRREVIAKLDGLLQSLFLDMFGEPATNSMNWTIANLAEVTDFQEGPGILAKDFRDGGTPLIRMAGLNAGRVSLNGCNFVDDEMVARKWSHFRLVDGDILVLTSASFGKPAVVDAEAVGAIFYTGIIRFKPSTNRIDAGFLKHFLASQWFSQQAHAMAAGAVIKHFGPTHLRKMTLPVPPLDLQLKFVRCAKRIEEMRNSAGRGSQLASQLFEGLQQKLFNIGH
jgi:type I restriction enzyme S subunit